MYNARAWCATCVRARRRAQYVCASAAAAAAAVAAAGRPGWLMCGRVVVVVVVVVVVDVVGGAAVVPVSPSVGGTKGFARWGREFPAHRGTRVARIPRTLGVRGRI